MCNYTYSNCCSCCDQLVKTTSVALTDNILTLTIPEKNFTNCQILCLSIDQAIPAGINSDTTVKLASGATTYTLVTPCCINFLYADQIVSNRVYIFKFGSDTDTFVYKGGWRLKRTAHNFA